MQYVQATFRLDDMESSLSGGMNALIVWFARIIAKTKSVGSNLSLEIRLRSRKSTVEFYDLVNCSGNRFIVHIELASD